MKSVRFGQTEMGSYIITVLSPVSPDLNSDILTSDSESPELPYEKKVVPAIHKALIAVVEAARKSAESQELAPFTSGVDSGITSNLCDAIIGLNESAEGGFIEIGFTLSPNRKNSHDLNTIIFEKEYTPILKDASRKIKEIEPQHDQEIIGYVVKLFRKEDVALGQVTIKDIKPDKERLVTLQLNDDEYSKAIQAHEQRSFIKINGTVSRQGRGYVLEPTTELLVCPFVELT